MTEESDREYAEVDADVADDGTIVTATHHIGRRVPNLVVRGVDELDILAHAPALVCDRVHWQTVDEFDPRTMLDDLPMEAWTRRWSDGQHRVWVPAGRGYEARESIKQWCIEREVEAVNVRVEPGVPFRNLDLIPDPLLPELIAAAVHWLFPRSFAIRRKIVADLELIDDQDVRSMMYLFVSDYADRYDAGREGRNGTLNFLAFLIGKLATWPQDAARTAYGRNVISDRVALHRAVDVIAATEQRPPTEDELAGALGTSITDLRRREQAISTLSSMRNYQSLVVGGPESDVLDTVQVASDSDVETEATGYDRNAQLTRAIISAVDDPTSTGRRAQDPLALAAVYLTFWEDLSRSEVARELEVLPKTAAAAVQRVLQRVESTDDL
jgi:hypothetical protein